MGAWELHDGAQQVGPLPEDHVRRMIETGLPEATLAREHGANEWRSLRAYPVWAIAMDARGRPMPRRGGATAGGVAMGAVVALVALLALAMAWSVVSVRASATVRPSPGASP